MIPFNKPYMTGKEIKYISQAHSVGQLAGDGPFTRKCHDWLERGTLTKKALLTHSGTAALEMAALLLDVVPGDEVIMPSFTFVSTANAFVLRGAVPVFVDIRADTLNLDEACIESAITPRTRAVVVVHYAGVACDMDKINEIAGRHGLVVVEDAAQACMSTYKGRALGSIGHFGAYSFHETKNLISGEGGALLIRDLEMVQRAEIIREKGTDRSRFFRGEVDKYTWQDIGSSYLPGELMAAFLFAQFEDAERITAMRLMAWDFYHYLFAEGESEGLLRRPVIPSECRHNGHMYFVLLPEGVDRVGVLNRLRSMGVGAVFHYVPLHKSPAGLQFGRAFGDLPVTCSCSERLIRLPLWVGISEVEQEFVKSALLSSLFN